MSLVQRGRVPRDAQGRGDHERANAPARGGFGRGGGYPPPDVEDTDHKVDTTPTEDTLRTLEVVTRITLDGICPHDLTTQLINLLYGRLEQQNNR